jgi:hypothetical protein
MAQCGDKYRGLLKNAYGHTPANPCRVYCNGPDAQAWREAAIALLSKVQSQWSTLVTRVGPAAIPPELLVDLDAYAASIVALPDVPTFALPDTWSAQVSIFIESMERGVCLLERIDDVFAASGQQAPKVPGVTPDTPFNPAIWLTVAAVGVIGYVGFKIARGLE